MQNQRNELAVIMPDEWQVLKQQAEALVASGFLPQSVNSPQKAVAIMTLGRELGVGAWAALSSINVIQGKPTVSPQLMLALINRSGQLDDMQMRDDGACCTVTMRRKGRTPHTVTFSMQDATAMGLSNKDNWKKQPAIMRQWRAVAAAARVVFPDVVLGLYTPEELGANVVADEQGNMTIVSAPEPPLRLAEPPAIEGEIVHEEEPSASIRGAGIPARQSVTYWTDDEQKFTAFYKSALDKFSMTQATVDEVLERFEGLNLADWRETRGWALAALVADFCDHNLERIDNVTASMGNGDEQAAFELRQRARQIANLIQFEAV